MSFETDPLGVGLGEDGVNGRTEGGKSCFCELVVPLSVICCFCGKEGCVEGGRSLMGETDGFGSTAGK